MATQTIRPNVDVSTGWDAVGASTIWDAINDDPASSDGDSTYIRTPAVNDGGASCEVALTDPAGNPAISSDHVLRVRARATTGGSTAGLVVELREAGTVIATRSTTPRIGYATSSWPLAVGEIAAISDYTDLRLRFVAAGLSGSNSIRITAAAVDLPTPGTPSEEVARTTRQVLGVVSSNPARRATRQVLGVLSPNPLSFPRATRQVVAVAVAAPGADLRRATRQVVGVAVANPLEEGRRATRQVVAVLAANPNTGARRATRQVLSVAVPNPSSAAIRATRQVVGVVSSISPVEIRRATRQVVAVAVPRTGLESTSASALPPVLAELLAHDATESFRVETAWMTDVTRSETGAEERWSLRSRPLRMLTSKATAIAPDAFARLLLSLRRRGQSRALAPIAPDQVDLVSWDGESLVGDFRFRRFFRGARVAVYTRGEGHLPADVRVGRLESVSDSELRAVPGTGISIPANDPGPWRVVPLVEVDVSLEGSARAISRDLGEAEVALLEAPGASALPPAAVGVPEGFSSRDGLPILVLRPRWSPGPEVGVSRDGERVALGRADVVVPTAPAARWRYDAAGLELSRGEVWRIVRLAESRRGRTLPFFVVAPEAIFRPVEIGADFVRVAPAGQIEDLALSLSYLGASLSTSFAQVLRVVDVLDEGATWKIELEGPWDGAVVSGTPRIAPARLVRFASDSFEEEWISTEAALARLSFVEVLDEADVALAPTPIASAVSAPEAVAGLAAWFDSSVGILSWPTAAGGWSPALPFPTVDLAANQPGWTVQRWLDARAKIASGAPEPLPTPRLDSADGSASYAALVPLASFNNGRPAIETLRWSGQTSRFRPRFGSTPWAKNGGSGGFTAFWVGLLPAATFVSLRNSAGAALLLLDAGSFQVFEVPGSTDPSKAALYTLPAPAVPSVPRLVVARWAPGEKLRVWLGGELRGESSVAVASIGGTPDPDQSFVLDGVAPAGSGSPVPPAGLAGAGGRTFHDALLVYARGLASSEINSVAEYLRGRFGAAWEGIA